MWGLNMGKASRHKRERRLDTSNAPVIKFDKKLEDTFVSLGGVLPTKRPMTAQQKRLILGGVR
jgi:hypothetical protein